MQAGPRRSRQKIRVECKHGADFEKVFLESSPLDEPDLEGPWRVGDPHLGIKGQLSVLGRIPLNAQPVCLEIAENV